MSPLEKSQIHSKSSPAATGSTPTAPASQSAKRPLSQDEKQQLIATAAYFRAQQRGFTPGGELDDWLAAEAEVDRFLMGSQASGPAVARKNTGQR